MKGITMSWQVVLSLILVLIALVLAALNYEGQELLAALVLVGAALYFRGFPG